LVLVLSFTWNWIFNLVSLALGRRLTCLKKLDGGGQVCASPARRTKVVSPKTGEKTKPYGHQLEAAQFQPLKKGKYSYAACFIALLFCLAVLYSW